jgi:hypothetical protein
MVSPVVPSVRPFDGCDRADGSTVSPKESPQAAMTNAATPARQRHTANAQANLWVHPGSSQAIVRLARPASQ